MTEKESSLLFQPFVQANTAHSKQFGGTGLGLALSLKLSQLLGGTVELVHTAPGNGSKFRAMVKPSVLSGVKYISQLKSKVSTTAEEKTFKEHELKNKKILVVDDSPDNQYLMRKILGLRGADVTLAGSGDSALDLDNISDFDVVLMDIQMPGKDGNQTTAELRKRGFTKPIIAFTANALPKDKELSLRSGCNRHVTKPVDQKELLRVLSELLTT
jgi:CheY-like chemotaxis protein